MTCHARTYSAGPRTVRIYLLLLPFLPPASFFWVSLLFYTGMDTDTATCHVPCLQRHCLLLYHVLRTTLLPATTFSFLFLPPIPFQVPTRTHHPRHHRAYALNRLWNGYLYTCSPTYSDGRSACCTLLHVHCVDSDYAIYSPPPPAGLHHQLPHALPPARTYYLRRLLFLTTVPISGTLRFRTYRSLFCFLPPRTTYRRAHTLTAWVLFYLRALRSPCNFIPATCTTCLPYHFIYSRLPRTPHTGLPAPAVRLWTLCPWSAFLLLLHLPATCLHTTYCTTHCHAT